MTIAEIARPKCRRRCCVRCCCCCCCCCCCTRLCRATLGWNAWARRSFTPGSSRAKTAKQVIALSKAHTLSAAAATQDWIPDCAYAWQVFSWSGGGYEPTDSEQLVCLQTLSDGANATSAKRC